MFCLLFAVVALVGCRAGGPGFDNGFGTPSNVGTPFVGKTSYAVPDFSQPMLLAAFHTPEVVDNSGKWRTTVSRSSATSRWPSIVKHAAIHPAYRAPSRSNERRPAFPPWIEFS